MQRRAFTLIELLVVVGIISLLIAVLVPVLSAARRSARDVQCASNIRQLCLALIGYASDHKGKFPPNNGDPASDAKTFWWYDEERIGAYISGTPVKLTAITSGYHHRPGLGGGVFVCPNDEGAVRSYAMNRWASSFPTHISTSGALNFGAGVRNGSKVILVTENYSIIPSPDGFVSTPICGPSLNRRPCTTFGAAGGHPAFWGNPGGTERYAKTPTHITYMNHRRRGEGEGTEPRGRLNIGYCDGHVEMKRHDQLADFVNDKHRFDSLWSPKDYELEHLNQ